MENRRCFGPDSPRYLFSSSPDLQSYMMSEEWTDYETRCPNMSGACQFNLRLTAEQSLDRRSMTRLQGRTKSEVRYARFVSNRTLSDPDLTNAHPINHHLLALESPNRPVIISRILSTIDIATMSTASPPHETAESEEEEGQAQPNQMNRLSCLRCKSSKLRCDRRLPSCTRCTQYEKECVFPRQRVSHMGKKKQVRDLDAKLGKSGHAILHFTMLIQMQRNSRASSRTLRGNMTCSMAPGRSRPKRHALSRLTIIRHQPLACRACPGIMRRRRCLPRRRRMSRVRCRVGCHPAMCGRNCTFCLQCLDRKRLTAKRQDGNLLRKAALRMSHHSSTAVPGLAEGRLCQPATRLSPAHHHGPGSHHPFPVCLGCDQTVYHGKGCRGGR